MTGEFHEAAAPWSRLKLIIRRYLALRFIGWAIDALPHQDADALLALLKANEAVPIKGEVR